ncbi:MAG: YeeE/YedE family protein [Alphaproteobacteria bacterium]|nr:YeeE/YedE family protein [Alphaproteobacteria bacterium]
MDLTWILDPLGPTATVSLGGLLIGLAFGATAQQSRFCLRAAVVEFARGAIGSKVSIWLLAFSGAVFATQLFLHWDILDVRDARQLAPQTSLSGAIIGGLMFGCGMVLARGCSSRLLVLSATGNLRALLSGLVFAVSAQAAYRGILAPARTMLSELWVVDGRGLINALPDMGNVEATLVLAIAFILGALFFAWHNRLSRRVWLTALGAGGTVAIGWLLTYTLSYQSFDPVSVESITFTGPSADTLMIFLDPASTALDFDVGLVPGVFLGSFLAAYMTNELKLEGFEGGPAMRRYLAGAAIMGFSGMLAGGCAVGAGITGGSVFSLPAWVALSGMWVGAGVTDYLLDRESEPQPSLSWPTA